MAELPEIAKLSTQMCKMLRGKTIREITIKQEKCTNVTIEQFQKQTEGSIIENIHYKGKWIITYLSNGEQILLSLGMGADVLYFTEEQGETGKYQIRLLLSDGTGYTIRFWWFGHFLLTHEDSEPKTRDIAIDPFDERFTFDFFASILQGKKQQIKAFLMDQKNVGGIGNMYMHDILFKGGIHPKKKIIDMTAEDIESLYNGIMEILNFAREKEAFYYEYDFFGKKGDFTADDFLVGYKEGKPCSVCGEIIVLIKTGSTSSYICPCCQKL